MTFTSEENEKLKTMMMFLVKRKHASSDGHCGFHLSDLKSIMDQLVSEGKIQLRPTINTYQYFLNKK